MKLTLYKKLLCGFLLILLLLSAIGFTAISKMRSMGEKSQQTTQIGLAHIIVLGGLDHDLKELNDLVLRVQLNLKNKDGATASQPEMAQQLFENLQARMEQLQGLASTERESRLIQLFHDNWNQYAAMFPGILSAAQQHGTEGLRLIQQADASMTFCAYVIEELTKANQKQANVWAGELSAAYESGVEWVVTLSLIAIAGGLIVSYLITRHITRPILLMSSAAKRISDGDLSAAYQPFARKDEIGELSSAFGQMTGHMRQIFSPSTSIPDR